MRDNAWNKSVDLLTGELTSCHIELFSQSSLWLRVHALLLILRQITSKLHPALGITLFYILFLMVIQMGNKNVIGVNTKLIVYSAGIMQSVMRTEGSLSCCQLPHCIRSLLLMMLNHPFIWNTVDVWLFLSKKEKRKKDLDWTLPAKVYDWNDNDDHFTTFETKSHFTFPHSWVGLSP